MTFSFDSTQRLRSSWNPSRLAMRGELTDKKIEEYRKRGWYSLEFKQARRDIVNRKKRIRRDGNFVAGENGNLVYSPL